MNKNIRQYAPQYGQNKNNTTIRVGFLRSVYSQNPTQLIEGPEVLDAEEAFP